MADSSSSLTVLWITQTELFAGCRSWSAASAVARTEFYSPRVESEIGFVRQPKKLVVECVSRGEMARCPSQKLPPTAIYCHLCAANPVRPIQPLLF